MAVARHVTRPVILSISPDPGLLISRTHVLRGAGYEVIAAMDRHIAVLAAANHSIDLAILCHALRQEEAEDIEHDLLTVRPGLATIRLQLHGYSGPGEDGLSPGRLLQLVRATLATRV